MVLDQSTRSVAILGCGWLGLPLAQALLSQGWIVKGSTTTPDRMESLRAAGIQPFQIVLDPALKGDRPEAFFDADVLVLNIPPGRRRDDHARPRLL